MHPGEEARETRGHVAMRIPTTRTPLDPNETVFMHFICHYYYFFIRSFLPLLSGECCRTWITKSNHRRDESTLRVSASPSEQDCRNGSVEPRWLGNIEFPFGWSPSHRGEHSSPTPCQTVRDVFKNVSAKCKKKTPWAAPLVYFTAE